MNRNVMNSMVAAMCLGAALSTASVWGESVRFICNETNAQLDCLSEEPFDFENGMVKQLELVFENDINLDLVIGLGTPVEINGLFLVVIDCLSVEGDFSSFDEVGEQCVLNEAGNWVEVMLDLDTNLKKRQRKKAKMRGRR